MAIARFFLYALISLVVVQQALVQATFDKDTYCVWGKDNCQINGDNLTLILNQWSGASVKGTKQFLFGYVNMRIKLVPDDAAAVVTTYFLSSPGPANSNETDTHDEIDFEFLGNVTNQPYTIHTNIFVNGTGGREEQFKPWFDPTSDYHNYTIFWSPYIVKWSIDGVVIRVFKNNENKGILFPNTRGMTVYSSIWNADDWACQGGLVKTNWTHQPFIARYLSYEDSVCLWTDSSSTQACSGSENWYTGQQYSQPTQTQIDDMNKIRSNFMIYSYCSDYKRYNGNMPQECYIYPYW